jgi:hypothetical protein
MFFIKKKNKPMDKDYRSKILTVEKNNKTYYITGFEILIIVSHKNNKNSMNPQIYSKFINAIRNKMNRSSNIYIVTNISKRVGGTALICIDRDPSIYLLCQVAATTLETISEGLIKTKELKLHELVKYLDPTVKIGGIEVPILHNLMNEDIENMEIPLSSYDNYSHLINNKLSIPIGETIKTKFINKIELPLQYVTRHIAIFDDPPR